MADPANVLRQRFTDAIVLAFGEEHRGTDPMIRRSDRADYQANCAMALAKKLGQKPRDVAAAIIAKLAIDDACETPEIAGPGFVNLVLKPAFLDTLLAGVKNDERLGVGVAAKPETVVIDYSSPNIAKEMHVGHVRSTIIGDALSRVLERLGHTVIRQNHLGDWGTPFGMLIEHLVDLGEEAGAKELSVGNLTSFYQEARKKFDADPAFAERARQRVVTLQGGDEQTLRLWRRLVDESRAYLTKVYDRLGIALTPADDAGESKYNPMLAPTIDELRSKGLVVESDGALCVFPPGFKGRDGNPLPLIVQKRDGGYGYATTDLAAIRYRTQTLHATRIAYVVGAPQREHFEMVFAAAKLAGWLVPPARAEHVAFGSILGSDKKMFKTRSGDTIKLIDLVDEATERAAKVIAEKNTELDEASRAELAGQVGLGAVKYSDLSNDRVKDYVFDWDRMLSFDGNTAPYLQYAHARICSIFRKGGGASSAGATKIAATQEKALAMALLGFEAAVEGTAETLEPHRLCTYLYDLATTFTSFYEACPVLKAESDELRASRLALCDLTAKVLASGLSLLGIAAPERM